MSAGRPGGHVYEELSLRLFGDSVRFLHGGVSSREGFCLMLSSCGSWGSNHPLQLLNPSCYDLDQSPIILFCKKRTFAFILCSMYGFGFKCCHACRFFTFRAVFSAVYFVSCISLFSLWMVFKMWHLFPHTFGGKHLKPGPWRGGDGPKGGWKMVSAEVNTVCLSQRCKSVKFTVYFNNQPSLSTKHTFEISKYHIKRRDAIN